MSLSLLALSAGAGLLSSYKRGQSQKQQAKLSQQWANRNREIAEIRKRDQWYQNAQDESLYRRKAQRELARQRNNLATLGLDGGTIDLLKDDATLAMEMDALMIRYKGQQLAKRSASEIHNFQHRANLHRFSKNHAMRRSIQMGLLQQGGRFGSYFDQWGND